AERQRWITQLKMMQAIKPTSFDFVSRYRGALIGTCIVALLGIAAIVARGSNLLDIDFTSGSSVQLQFDPAHPQKVATVRKEAQEVLPPGLVVSELRIAGEQSGLQFLLNTSNSDINDVEKLLEEKFGDKLARNQMTVSDVAEFVPSEERAGAATSPAGASSPATAADPSATPAAETPAPAAETAAEPTVEPAAEPTAKPAAEPTEPAAVPAPESQPPAKTPPSEANPQSSYRAGDERLLALADNRLALAFAQETPVDAPSEAPAEQAPPAEPAATAEPATEEKAPAEPAAGEQPAGEAADNAATALANSAVATKAQLEFKEPVDHDTLRDTFKEIIPDVDVVLSNPDYVEGSGIPYRTWEIQIPLDRATAEPALNAAAKQFSEQVFFPSASKIGASVAAETRQQAVLAVLASLILIVIYIWLRFQNVAFGLAAVVALAFDVIITLGALAASYYLADFLGFLLIEPFKVNLTIIAAFLTIIGYSINDKIVVFDRIREVRGKSPLVTPAMVNLSVNQTLSRTLLTGTTTILVLLILYVTGGDAIHGFAFSLLVGVLVGTYTSIFVGTPILLWLMKPAGAAQAADESRSSKALPSGTR
ncbi:MAG: protein translocase subunit SecF, partial [Planctomycetaceae bacterium]|nr:protein translocase subunit SecF [Planctomycetaceae bacterium]